MSAASDGVVVADAIRRAATAAGLPWPPRAGVPVPLDELIGAQVLIHDEVPGLTRALAGARLARENIVRPELLADATPLAGFLFANAAAGYILVRRDDPLPRRRFTAAHELGHYLMHLPPGLRADDLEASWLRDDGEETVREEDEAKETGPSLPGMERQANRFAAEVLMPEEVVRGLHAEYARKSGAAARFLEHHLAGDLLVSCEAMRWRLRSLGLG